MNCKYLNLLVVSAVLLGSPIMASSETEKAPVTKPVAQQAEARVLGALEVLNKNEIAAGQLAEQKSNNKAVKKFAAMMIREHGKNLKKIVKVSRKLNVTPIQGPVAVKLQRKGQQEAAMLKKLSPDAFDKDYINAMVKGHTEALSLVSGLIQEASNPLVKKYLEDTKGHISKHLQKATAIQKEMQG